MGTEGREKRRLHAPFWLARLVATAARVAARATGSGGSTVPGKVLLALHPRAMRRMAAGLNARIVLVSATNGKTTASAMLAGMCERAGLRVEHNMTGANLRSGIATSMLQAVRSRPDIVLLETDEATLSLVVRDLQPAVIVLGNLFRDQLDRYGELETLADRWVDALQYLGTDASSTTVVYNADDPLIAELATRIVTYGIDHQLAFGVDDPSVAAAGLPHAADSKFCRRCSHPLTYEHSYVGHLGAWHCESCGFARPARDVQATQVTLDGLAASTVRIDTPAGEVSARLRIPGLYNVYNALAAVAAAHALVISTEHSAEGLTGFSPAFGRFERVPVPGGGTLTLLLVKNPTGLNEVVRTVTGAGVDLSACLFALNDGIADGRDTSWVWDADVEPLLEAAPALVITGERAAEFALRAVYGGADARALTVVDDIETALDTLLARARDFSPHGHAYALVTYTAMLRMRAIISERGWVSAYWRERSGAPDVTGARR